MSDARSKTSGFDGRGLSAWLSRLRRARRPLVVLSLLLGAASSASAQTSFLEVTPAADPLPADCPCISVCFCGDKVYPCGVGALKDINGCSIEDDWVTHLRGIDPRRQELCRTCFSNRKNRKAKALPLIVEWNLWESRVGGLLVFQGRHDWLRHIYRWWLWAEKSVHALRRRRANG